MDSEKARTADRSAPGRAEAPTADLEFWEDWRDHRWIAAVPPSTVPFSLLLVAVGRSGNQTDSPVVTLLLLLAAGFLVCILWSLAVAVPVFVGWGLGGTVVRCSPEGITVNGVFSPWEEVRSLSLGQEAAPQGTSGAGRWRRRAAGRYHLDVHTRTGARPLTAAFPRRRAHELAEGVGALAPGVPVQWQSGDFRLGGPPRRRQPSTLRMRTETVALAALFVLFCLATLRLAQGWMIGG